MSSHNHSNRSNTSRRSHRKTQKSSSSLRSNSIESRKRVDDRRSSSSDLPNDSVESLKGLIHSNQSSLSSQNESTSDDGHLRIHHKQNSDSRSSMTSSSFESDGSDSDLSDVADDSFSGNLQRKDNKNWKSGWNPYYYMLEGGLLIEYKNSSGRKPRKVWELRQYAVKLANTVTGRENTFGLFSIAGTETFFFMAPSESKLIHWVKKIHSRTNQKSAIAWQKNMFLEALNDGVIMADENGLIIAVNRSFCEMYNYDQHQLIGNNVTCLMEERFAVNHTNYLQRYAQSGKGKFIGTARQYNVMSGDGNWIPSEISLGQMSKSTDSKVSFIGRFRRCDRQEESDEIDTKSFDRVVEASFVQASEVIKIAARNEYVQLRKKLNKANDRVRRLERKLHSKRKKKGSKQAASSSSKADRADRSIEIVTSHGVIEIGQRLADTGGSGAGIFSAFIDGWQCVVKELPISGLPPSAIEMFEREISTLQKLPRHKNVCRYLYSRRTSISYQIFMTRYDCSLNSILSEKRRLNENFSPKQAIGFFLDICRGLRELHSHHIVHRDLKPANVLIRFDKNGVPHQVKLCDYGSHHDIIRPSVTPFVTQ
mmetsp:Transcript_14682/g.21927  ORF Transcript_14682/g.21927 Transcript_14682/m.21927 type:complete len:595 (-) Transcript_14682:26-1810(-)